MGPYWRTKCPCVPASLQVASDAQGLPPAGLNGFAWVGIPPTSAGQPLTPRAAQGLGVTTRWNPFSGLERPGGRGGNSLSPEAPSGDFRFLPFLRGWGVPLLRSAAGPEAYTVVAVQSSDTAHSPRDRAGRRRGARAGLRGAARGEWRFPPTRACSRGRLTPSA